MFRRSRAHDFSLSGRRRSRAALPRWLVLLLCGTVAGAGGLWWVQENHLPPRLTAAESAQLREAATAAQRERDRLTAELTEIRQSLQAAQTAQRALQQDLDTERAAAKTLRGDLEALVSALPPDPRQDQVQVHVRAASFAVKDDALDYKLVLTRDRSAGKPLTGQVQLLLTGTSASRSGTGTSVAMQPIALSLASHQVLRGRLPLPVGFRPERSTVRVLDSKAGTLLGTRVLLVQ